MRDACSFRLHKFCNPGVGVNYFLLKVYCYYTNWSELHELFIRTELVFTFLLHELKRITRIARIGSNYTNSGNFGGSHEIIIIGRYKLTHGS